MSGRIAAVSLCLALGAACNSRTTEHAPNPALEAAARHQGLIADARAQLAKGNPDAAIESFEAAHKITLLAGEDALAVAQLLKDRGTQERTAERVDLAIETLRRAEQFVSDLPGLAKELQAALAEQAKLDQRIVPAFVSARSRGDDGTCPTLQACVSEWLRQEKEANASPPDEETIKKFRGIVASNFLAWHQEVSGALKVPIEQVESTCNRKAADIEAALVEAEVAAACKKARTFDKSGKADEAIPLYMLCLADPKQEPQVQTRLGVLRRSQFGSIARNKFLDDGLDIKVRVHGPDNTTMTLTYPLFDAVWAHKMKQGDLVQQVGQEGFKKVLLTDGHDWAYEMTFR